MMTSNNFVILNLFQDNAPLSPVIPKQVRDNENVFDQISLRRGMS